MPSTSTKKPDDDLSGFFAFLPPAPDAAGHVTIPSGYFEISNIYHMLWLPAAMAPYGVDKTHRLRYERINLIHSQPMKSLPI